MNIKLPEISIPTRISCGYTGYQTNKFDLKSNTENGGWVVGWADDIAEKDVLLGLVAAGVSVASSEPGPFLLWVEELVSRTTSTLLADLDSEFKNKIRKQVSEVASRVIRDAILGKDSREELGSIDTLDFKVGAIKYSGKNKVCGNTVSTTWGMKPYIGLRLR